MPYSTDSYLHILVFVFVSCVQGCRSCCSLAAGLRGNGEIMRKWRENEEIERKWRENEEIYRE